MLYIWKFCHLEIASGAVDATKILLFEFNRGTKAAEAARNICTVYVDNAIGENTARKLFSRLKEDRFDISDTQRSGRTSGFE